MKIPKFFRKKKNIIITIISILIFVSIIYIFINRNNNITIQTSLVERQNLEQTVLATGQVVSGTDLSLSFQSSGVVSRILVKEGDRVERGQILANLDQSSALANLTSAKGTLAQYQALYDKLVAGSSGYGIASYEIALDGANKDALNSLNDASLKSYNALAAVVNLQNNYFKGYDGDARNAKAQIERDVDIINSSLNKAKKSGLQEDIDSAVSLTINSLNSISSSLAIIRSTLDTPYYYGLVPEATKQEIDTQRANINSALASVTANQKAISSAKLSLLQSGPEIDAVKAQILSAQGQVAAAQAVLNNTIITAPSNGIITKVDIKVGEQATALKEAIVLQDTDNLYIEADISEANIAVLNIGQKIDYTFDALGQDEHFSGELISINPASTIVSGVVNYRVKASFEKSEKIKPGMTANMTIMVDKKENVLAVPSTAIINKNRKNYVRVVDDIKNRKYHEVEVKTGLQADGGLVEIIEGLNEGQEVIIYIK